MPENSIGNELEQLHLREDDEDEDDEDEDEDEDEDDEDDDDGDDDDGDDDDGDDDDKITSTITCVLHGFLRWAITIMLRSIKV